MKWKCLVYMIHTGHTTFSFSKDAHLKGCLAPLNLPLFNAHSWHSQNTLSPSLLASRRTPESW